MAINDEPDLFISSSRNEQAICDLLNEIFIDAATRRVADVHFHETEGTCRVRFRLPGGTVWERSVHDFETARVFDNKIRSRSKMSYSEHESPLDGRMSFRINGEGVDVRVALTPGVSGQLIVCRLLMQANGRKNLANIFMSPSVRLTIKRILEEPDGLFVVTGPTGSGKSTMLYSILNELNNGERNIVTIEDPVEYRIQEFHQMPVSRNLTFADGLRAALRQDPDIIMVGEIRDSETASVAIQASITGHLVLSTIHANTASEAITRFVKLGIDHTTLGTALRAISAQRLLKRVSPDCPKKPLTVSQKTWLNKNGIVPDPGMEYFAPENDEHYLTDEYVPVIELMTIDSCVQIEIGRGSQEIVNAASRQAQYETLARCGERLAAQGLVSLSDVMRITSNFSTVRVNTRRLGELAVERGLLPRKTLWEIIAKQAEDRMAGLDPVHIGQTLVERGLCTSEQVVEMAGFTLDAKEVIERLIKSDQDRHSYYRLLDTWVPGEQSLFDMAFCAGLCELGAVNEIFRV